MSQNFVINGVTYPYPDVGESDWGQPLVDWSNAVTNGMLQKSGGAFTLTAEVDFGGSFGVKSLYYKSRTSNPASAGQIRLARADVISWRNQANGADLSLGVDSSDRLTWPGDVVLENNKFLKSKNTAAAVGSLIGRNGSDELIIGESTFNNPIRHITGNSYQTFENNGSEKARILASGFVGIGIASPQAIFQVKQASNIDLLVAGATALTGAISLNAVNDNNSANIPMEFRASKFNFSTGNVGIGADPGATLHVMSESADVDSGLRLERTGATAGRYNLILNASGQLVVRPVDDTTVGILMASNGAVTLQGSKTNDSAAAGKVGEYVQSVITSNTNFPTSGQWGDLTNISLTAGDWDVVVALNMVNNGATVTDAYIGQSATSGNSTPGNSGDTYLPIKLATAVTPGGGCLSAMRVSLSGTTTIYFKYFANYSVATPQANGRISARRVR